MHRSATLSAVLVLVLVLVLGALVGCAPAPPPAPVPPEPEPAVAEASALTIERPILYPVRTPSGLRRAVAAGTRSETGAPGPRYWQHRAEYDIEARVDPGTHTLAGSQTVRFHNRSPEPLAALVVNLNQNYHAEGVERVRPTEVTGGMTMERVTVDGAELGMTSDERRPGWMVDGTVMYIVLPRPLAAGRAVELTMDWSFPLPRVGAGGRMGYEDGSLLFLAYWYPHLAVHDDVFGWHLAPFRGNAEFYSNFARYAVTVDVPAGWLVASTGRLTNAGEVLRPEVIERLESAGAGADVIRVVEHGGAADATMAGTNARLRWRFEADSVRDVAFAVMRDHAWDAVSVAVGAGRTMVHAYWRDQAVHYPDAAEYGRHAVGFFSELTGVDYPWPHMTLVEGGGIIGGGMEYPMMTLLGDYNLRGARALYGVIAHEIAHMWVPMILSTDERRYAWFDEGITSFATELARADRFPDTRPFRDAQQSYLGVAAAGLEGPIMRWSDFHYPGPAYGVASYPKPAAVLYALKGVLGEETFLRAYREFHRRWAFKHPYPWDMWRTFEDVSGRELEWFWRAWFYESTGDGGRWWLDQAVADVERLPSGETRITVRDLGWIPMPVHLTVTRQTGDVIERVVPVETWLTGADRVTVTIPAGPRVRRVEIDAAGHFPDMDRSNNVWTGR